MLFRSKYGESVTLGLSYVPEIKAYGSLIFSKFPFNSILATVLLRPLIGVLMLCTDGHKAYNVAEHIRCLVHLAKK